MCYISIVFRSYTSPQFQYATAPNGFGSYPSTPSSQVTYSTQVPQVDGSVYFTTSEIKTEEIDIGKSSVVGYCERCFSLPLENVLHCSYIRVVPRKMNGGRLGVANRAMRHQRVAGRVWKGIAPFC